MSGTIIISPYTNSAYSQSSSSSFSSSTYASSDSSSSSSSLTSSTSSQSTLSFSEDAVSPSFKWAERDSCPALYEHLTKRNLVVITHTKDPVFSRFFHLHECDGKEKDETYLKNFAQHHNLTRFYTEDRNLLLNGCVNKEITQGDVAEVLKKRRSEKFYECTCNLRTLAEKHIPANAKNTSIYQ